MPCSDNSFTARIQRTKGKTLSLFRQLNPVTSEGGARTFTEVERTDRVIGQIRYTVQPDIGGEYSLPCCSPTTIN